MLSAWNPPPPPSPGVVEELMDFDENQREFDRKHLDIIYEWRYYILFVPKFKYVSKNIYYFYIHLKNWGREHKAIGQSLEDQRTNLKDFDRNLWVFC